MWAPQHFNSLHIEYWCAIELAPTIVDSVDEHCRRLLDPGIDSGTDAADVDVVADARLGHGEIGNVGREVLDIVYTGLVYSVAGHDVHGNGNILEALFALLCRNDDLFQYECTGVLGRRNIRKRESGHCGGQEEAMFHLNESLHF